MAKAINTTLLVALLIFLSAFYVANVNLLSGFYSYKGVRGCALGDVDHNGVAATDNDVETLETFIETFIYKDCADLNKDGTVNSDDLSILFEIKSKVDASRQTRGRYCFNECPAKGEIICTSEGTRLDSGATIARAEGVTYKECGNFDEDICLELSSDTFACPQGTRCRPKNPGSDICLSNNLAEENVLVTQY